MLGEEANSQKLNHEYAEFNRHIGPNVSFQTGLFISSMAPSHKRNPKNFMFSSFLFAFLLRLGRRTMESVPGDG